MKPKFSDLITYINKALTGNDWNTNWQKIVNWLTLGTYDLKVNKIETNEIENSGTFTQNGDLIADNVQADTVTANSFVGDGSGLDNVRVTNTFPYTPFSVNKGQVNSNGYGTFIDYSDTSKLVFRVGGDYSPLVVTTAKGKTITINSINDYDVSGLNGTYNIFVDEETNGGTVYLKTGIIYRQLTTPTGQNGDIWLDIRQEPYICREKVSNNWYTNEYDKVPIAIVVISGGTITDVKTLPFAVNGANVVYDGQYSDESRPIVVVRTYELNGTWYRVYSDGWVEQGGVTEGGSSGDRYITLPIEMKYTNYCITLSAGIGNNSGSANDTVEDITTTGFKIWSGSPSYYTWKVEGIMK